jgi:glycerol-3-phosphate dehydrogenase (NAD(P)+)
MTAGPTPIVVLGTGSWGTALAVLLARNGNSVRLWGRDARAIDVMRKSRLNTRYLPTVSLPPALVLESDLGRAVSGAGDILITVPSAAFHETLRQLVPLLQPGMRLAWATKGLEPGSGKLLHQVVAEETGRPYPTAVVSGPSFAREVAEGLPTAVTVAAEDSTFASDMAARLHNETFRAYTSNDVVGVEIGGAVKNVLAIAAGISDGLGFGANTRAALITRGLAEMVRLGTVLGGRNETLVGLTGLGDLLLTCTDDQSRNRRLGLALGRGVVLEQALAEIKQVVEGVHTAREVHDLALRYGIEMPITEQVYQVLYAGLAPRNAVHNLMQRDQKAEHA